MYDENPLWRKTEEHRESSEADYFYFKYLKRLMSSVCWEWDGAWDGTTQVQKTLRILLESHQKENTSIPFLTSHLYLLPITFLHYKHSL